MIQVHKISFGFIERMSRAAFGFVLLLLSFTIALSLGTDWFATLNIVAMYPLLTALVAWDPIYFLVEIVKESMSDYYILHR